MTSNPDLVRLTKAINDHRRVMEQFVKEIKRFNSRTRWENIDIPNSETEKEDQDG